LIDFEKAFDKIWRGGLWYKLLINNINGKMLNVIQNIYRDIKLLLISKPSNNHEKYLVVFEGLQGVSAIRTVSSA
jgi:hypothetical protein